MPYSQAERPFRIKTPLGDDALLLDSFTGEERVSTPYRFVLRLLASDPNIKLKDLLAKPAVIGVKLPDKEERSIHGLFNRLKLLEYGEDGMAAYEAELVPWLWFLTRFSDCRIFQNKSVPDIIEQVFKDRGFSDYKLQLQGTYNAREYCVQYRETDFNFVSRLMEDEGIFYYFEQSRDKHTLVLADTTSALAPCPIQKTAHYLATTGTVQPEDTVITLEEEFRVVTGSTALTDYDFEKPKTKLMAKLSGPQSGEDYDYPGNYKNKADGDRYARIRLEEREAAALTVRGTSNCDGFECGYTFTLSDHYRDDANGDYVLLALHHRAHNSSYRSGKPMPYEYHNSFEAMPSSVPYRPPRNARKPLIQGTQTAVITGKSGEEIWTDKHGRVKVQFFWDRLGKADENSSCWIRVAQGWAGKGFGAFFLPRMGHEVVVSFLEGDPDRPLITGSVHNAETTPPYALPGEQTKSTLKTLSSKGGGGFNEFRFEDNKGKEEIFLHAEKDQHIRVKNDVFETIGNERHLSIEKDQFEEVKGDLHLHTKGDQNQKVDGTVSRNAGMNIQEKAGMNYALDAGQEIHLKAGMTVVMEAGVNLTIKVGGNFININPSGVYISGMMVYINSGGSAGSGSGSSPQAATAPKLAVDSTAGSATTAEAPPALTRSTWPPTTAQTLSQASKSGAPFCAPTPTNAQEEEE